MSLTKKIKQLVASAIISSTFIMPVQAEEVDNPNKKVKAGVYGTNESIGLNFKLEDKVNNLLYTIKLDEYLTKSSFNLKENSLKLVYLTKNHFIALKTGINGKTGLLKDSLFTKLQFGTRQKQHKLNYHAGFIYLRAPNIIYFNKDFPLNRANTPNILGLNAEIDYHPIINTHIGNLSFNINSLISLFYQPYSKIELFNTDTETSRNFLIRTKGLGEPAVFAFSHWKTLFDIILNTKYLNIGLNNNVDIASTIIHDHNLLLEYDYKSLIRLQYKFGARFFHNIYTDTSKDSIIKQTFWNYGNRIDLISTMDAILALPYGFRVKGYTELNHSNANLNRYVVSLTKIFKGWNIEAYGMYDGLRQFFSVGVNLNINLDNNDYINPDEYDNWHYPITDNLYPDITTSMHDPKLLHTIYGNTIDEAVKKIHTYQDLSRFLSFFAYRDVKYGFESVEKVYATGSSNCEGLNGSLIPYILKNTFGLEAGYAPVIQPGFYHVIAWAKTKSGTYDIWNYESYYHTNEKDLRKAIEKVYPGAFITRDGALPVTEKVRKLLEERLYNE